MTPDAFDHLAELLSDASQFCEAIGDVSASVVFAAAARASHAVSERERAVT